MGIRISTESVAIHLESDSRKAIAEIIAHDTITGMIITDVGSMKLSGTIGGLELKDSTEAGGFTQCNQWKGHGGDELNGQLTIDILQPLFAFQLRLRGSGIYVHYLIDLCLR